MSIGGSLAGQVSGGGKGGATAPSTATNTNAATATPSTTPNDMPTTSSPFGSGGIYDWSANQLAGAGGAMQQAAGLYGSPTLGANAPTVSGVGPTSTIQSQMSRYQNPYENQVINNSLADMQRMNTQQLRDVGAQAQKSGAFGGSRHGIVEAVTNAETNRAAGDLSANLRHQGFNTAAGLAGQDISNTFATQQLNKGLQQFNAGQQQARDLALSQDQLARAAGLQGVSSGMQGLSQSGYNQAANAAQGQMDAGNLQQQLVQSVMNGAAGQFDATANQPMNMLDIALASLGMSPLNNNRTQTSSYTPGLYDWASLIGQTWAGSR
jgi:hypothetical protein